MRTRVRLWIADFLNKLTNFFAFAALILVNRHDDPPVSPKDHSQSEIVKGLKQKALATHSELLVLGEVFTQELALAAGCTAFKSRVNALLQFWQFSKMAGILVGQ